MVPGTMGWKQISVSLSEGPVCVLRLETMKVEMQVKVVSLCFVSL
jgi:hypothetical protein